MAQYIKQADIFGRMGTGLGKGLAEQLPKEVERSRLSYGLKALGEKKDQSPMDRLSGLISVAHEYPQVIQTGGDVLNRQSMLESLGPARQGTPRDGAQVPGTASQEQAQNAPKKKDFITTPESTQAALDPFVPPSGAERAEEAKDLFRQFPLVYESLAGAQAFVDAKYAADTQKSEALQKKRQSEIEVSTQLADGMDKKKVFLRAEGVPRSIDEKERNKISKKVTSGEMGIGEAVTEYGKELSKISRVFSDVKSIGGLFSLLTSKSGSILSAIRQIKNSAKEGGYRKEIAEELTASTGITPQMSYANIFPVSEQKETNDILKSLQDINPRAEKVAGLPGMAGIGMSRPNNASPKAMTKKISPELAKAMGREGSPLAAAYELQKKGYDDQVFIDYLTEHADALDLSDDQREQLRKPKPSFFGQLNDWMLSIFSGVD